MKAYEHESNNSMKPQYEAKKSNHLFIHKFAWHVQVPEKCGVGNPGNNLYWIKGALLFSFWLRVLD